MKGKQNIEIDSEEEVREKDLIVYLKELDKMVSIQTSESLPFIPQSTFTDISDLDKSLVRTRDDTHEAQVLV